MTESRTPMDLTHEELLELGAAYVLDALDADELEAVRAHLSSCPLDHSELADLASVVPLLAQDIPQVEPPAGLRDRIMAAAAADQAADRTSTTPAPVAERTVQERTQPAPEATAAEAAPIAFPSAEERTTRAERTTSRGTWVLRIAAVLAIALLGGWNLLLQGQINDAKAFQQEVAAVVEVASQPGSLTAVLRGENGGPSGLAAISADGSMSVALQGLPPTSGSQVYEAWMIGPDGVPVALGGFPLASGGTAFMEAPGIPTAPGITIALTLEPNAGNTAPAGPVVSAGTTTATG
jgi:hypothetical protein